MSKVFLIVILMASDGAGYSDYVAALPSMEQCEKARAGTLDTLKASAPKGALVYSICTKGKPLRSIGA